MNWNEEKKKFRQTKEWKCFREKMKDRKVDALTLSKLRKGWSLHHLDLDAMNYGNLDEDHFVCLNNKSHDAVHFLYNYYKKDRKVLDRLKSILDKMIEINGVNNEQDF